jgi:MFS family permease
MIAKWAQGRVYYGWIVVAIAFLTFLTTAGVRSTPGVLIVPLEKEFGWDRATVSVAAAISLFMYGLCGPFAAAVMDRFGMRRVMVSAMTVTTFMALLSTLVTAPWQLDLAWGVGVGLGTGVTATSLGAVIANRWFVARRGLVMGILTASTATGQLLFLPLLAGVSVMSWRTAVFLIAGVMAMWVPLVWLCMRNSPADLALRPLGADETQPIVPYQPITSNPFQRALRALWEGSHQRDFWLLSGSFFVCGASTNGLVGTHLIPASVEHGMAEVAAAGLLATMGVFNLVGTTASGWLTDRFDSRKLLTLYYSARGLSLLALPYALDNGSFPLMAFVVFYGLDWIATVPPTVRLAADRFGREKVGMMYGWIMVSHQIGSAAVAYGAGVWRTWFGDYQGAFMTSGLLCLLAAGLVIRIGQATRTSTPATAPGAAVPSPAS